MKKGDLVYITVNGFSPNWRQAVVVSVNKQEKKLVFAVRVVEAELSEKWKELSFFELSGEKFILVEGSASQARQTCEQRHRALELEADLIIKRAKELVNSSSDELLYATASEDAAVKSRKGRRAIPEDLERSDSSSGFEESGDSQDDDDLLKLLSRAKSNLRGGDTGLDVLGRASSSSKPSKSRYPMLSGGKEKVATKKDSVIETLLQQSLVAGAGSKALGGDQINTLLQMEMLKLLQDKSKKNVKTEEKDTSDSMGSDEDSSADNRERLRGAGKALKAYIAEKERRCREIQSAT